MLKKEDWNYMFNTNEILTNYFNEAEDSYKIFTRLVEEVSELVVEIVDGNKQKILEESEDVIRGTLQLITHYDIEYNIKKDFLNKIDNKYINSINNVNNIIIKLFIDTGKLAELINHQEESGIKTFKKGTPDISNIINKIIDIIKSVLDILYIYNINKDFPNYIKEINSSVKNNHT